MDPEKPPRRKKSGETPVTIDLEAAPNAGENEPSAPTASEDDAKGSFEADTKPSAASFDQQDAVPDERVAASDAAAADSGRDALPPYSSSYEPPPTQVEAAPSKSGAFAAAILGGLVALAGAGALQYGGYLPTLAPDTRSRLDLEPLSAEVEALKARFAQIPLSAPGSDLQPIESRLAALENAAAQAPAATELTGEAQQSVATLEATVAKLTADIATLREEAAAAQGASQQVAQLSQRLDAAEQKLEEPRNDVAMARAVAATALKTAIDRGGPYLAELEAYASVAPDDPSVASLRPQAAIGVSSRADLVRAFVPVADQMIEAVHQPAGDQGIVDRLISSAASAITIRPVGSVEGDSPEAIVARIENKLQNGDLKGAQIEWQALPETARNAGAAFKTTLDERLAVEDGVNAIVSGAMAKNGNQG